MAWTQEQVLALAPDEKAAKAGIGQSSPSRWSGTGQNERALWGLCQGSGSEPYQTTVDLSEPAFRCSCPSRKFPCKHSLGLLLLWVNDPGAVPAAEPADFAAEWLAGRDSRAHATETRAKSQADEPAGPDAQAAAARRAEDREGRVLAGLDELELWLGDLVRQGLAQAQQRPGHYWEQMAARLVDAQASGLARRVRAMRGLVAAGGDWPASVLAGAAQLQLLIDAYRAQDRLDDAARAEVRVLVGWSVKQEDVLAGAHLTDAWTVHGLVVDDDGQLQVRRVWLHGKTHGWALILDFAPSNRPLPGMPPPVGHRLDADVAFYPGTSRRAVIADQRGSAPVNDHDAEPLTAAADRRARWLADDPFATRVPVLAAVCPQHDRDGWWLSDADGRAVRAHPRARAMHHIAAVCGGTPVPVFCEWDAAGLLPLTAGGVPA